VSYEVEETCGCGASIKLGTDHGGMSWLDDFLEVWRNGHKHPIEEVELIGGGTARVIPPAAPAPRPDAPVRHDLQ
jgi:hypothetical protein